MKSTDSINGPTGRTEGESDLDRDGAVAPLVAGAGAEDPLVGGTESPVPLHEASPTEQASDAPQRSSADEPPQMLDPRVVVVNRIVGSIVGVVFAGIHLMALLIVLVTADWPAWGKSVFAVSWFPVTGLLAWLALKWPEIDYRHWRYRVDSRGIEIWSGVIFREAVVVPRSRVQHIDVSQGPIERSYGLATVSIYTAGTEYSKIDLPGLAHSVALATRDALLPKHAEPAV